MKIKAKHFRIPNIVILILCVGIVGVVNSPTIFGQDSEEKSQREAEAIKKVEAVGGRVLQISSADSNREVSFYLAGEKVKDEHIKDLGAVQNVIWLNLANTKVTNDGLQHIRGMKLAKLHLEKTGIGDEGLAHLKDMVELEYLNLYATEVTDEGLKHLEKMSKLKRLYVWQSKVTEEGMKALEEKISGLKVVGECKLPVIEPPKKEEPKKEEPKKEKPKKEEAKKDEAKKEEPKPEADQPDDKESPKDGDKSKK